MGLFKFFSDGRKDRSRDIVPTAGGYGELHKSLTDACRSGYGDRINPYDPDVQRAAAEHGKTVEDYVNYDLRTW